VPGDDLRTEEESCGSLQETGWKARGPSTIRTSVRDWFRSKTRSLPRSASSSVKRSSSVRGSASGVWRSCVGTQLLHQTAAPSACGNQWPRAGRRDGRMAGTGEGQIRAWCALPGL